MTFKQILRARGSTNYLIGIMQEKHNPFMGRIVKVVQKSFKPALSNGFYCAGRLSNGEKFRLNFPKVDNTK